MTNHLDINLRVARVVGSALLALLPPVLAHAQAAPPVMVGVLRPKVEVASSHLLDQVPAQYRAMVGAQMAAMQKRMSEQMPGAVARAWIEMLERKGVGAIALDADTAEAGAKEAKAKGVSFLLASSVAGEKKAGRAGAPTQLSATHGLVATGPGEQSATLTLALAFSVLDGAGHLLGPAKQTSCDAEKRTENGSSSDMNLSRDVWADCGSQLVAGVAAVLPLGTVKYLDPSTLLPHPPEMAQSLRVDMSIEEQTLYKGKRLPGMDELERDRKSIIEFAADSISLEQRGQGLIYTPDADRLYMIDDKARTYSTMTAEDLTFVRSFGAQTAAAEKPDTPRLTRIEATGSTVRYAVSEGPAASPDPSATTIEIEYGDPLPAWQHGIVGLQRFSAEMAAAPVRLGGSSYYHLAPAIWAELATNPAPPRRILIHSAETVGRKKNPMSSSTEVLFDTSQTPRPVDFTIPKDYQWHTNPLLNMIWMP